MVNSIPGLLEDDTTEARAARRAWARLIKKIYEVDPLICPECRNFMRSNAYPIIKSALKLGTHSTLNSKYLS